MKSFVEGKFVLSKNENYDAYLKHIGIPDELAAKLIPSVPTLENKFLDEDVLIIRTTAGPKRYTNVVNFGQDSYANVATLLYKLNVKETDSGYSGTMALGGMTGVATTEETEEGFVQIINLDNVTAKRYFKRV